jgi:hypothetical protein
MEHGIHLERTRTCGVSGAFARKQTHREFASCDIMIAALRPPQCAVSLVKQIISFASAPASCASIMQFVSSSPAASSNSVLDIPFPCVVYATVYQLHGGFFVQGGNLRNIPREPFVEKSPGILDPFESTGCRPRKFGIYSGYAQIVQQMMVEMRRGFSCELEQFDGQVLLDRTYSYDI